MGFLEPLKMMGQLSGLFYGLGSFDFTIGQRGHLYYVNSLKLHL